MKRDKCSNLKMLQNNIDRGVSYWHKLFLCSACNCESDLLPNHASYLSNARCYECKISPRSTSLKEQNINILFH